MPSAQDIYVSNVRCLPRSEQLRLAAIILEELTESAAEVLDFSDAWTAEDVRDVTTFSLQHAAATYPEGDDIV